MVYKSPQDMMPDYITAHLTEYKPPRLLRLSEVNNWLLYKCCESIEDVFIQVKLIVWCMF